MDHDMEVRMPPSKAPPASSNAKPQPLTEDELSYLREIIEDRKWSRRFWTTIRTYALWIAGVVGGASVGYEALRKAVTFLVKG